LAIVSIRRQGGAAIMTIPSEVLKTLEIDVGAELEIAVAEGGFTARPKLKPCRNRYSLRELLRGATPSAMRKLNDATGWARAGDSIGREL
jgi:antitoxin ChpS